VRHQREIRGDLSNVAGRQRVAEEISLDGVAAQFLELYCCFPVFHAFGDTGDAERLGEVDGRPCNCRGASIVDDRGDELMVEFDVVGPIPATPSGPEKPLPDNNIPAHTNNPAVANAARANRCGVSESIP
jgi:hypothetical protein